jgi:hypothetical protein
MRSGHNIICALAIALTGIVLEPHALGAPDRAQFIRECLDAAATPETPKFDDYTEGSYDIHELDLLKGLAEATESQPGRLRAVIILGPSGPLRTYYILVALSEGDLVRLNSIVMPHGRITGKGTTTLSEADFEALLAKVTTSKALSEGNTSSKKADDPPSRYDLLVAVYSKGGRSLRFAEVARPMSEATSGEKDAKELLDHINAMYKGISTTYPKKDDDDMDEKKVPTNK